MQDGVVADACVTGHMDVGVQFHAVADHGAVFHDHAGADVTALTHHRVVVDRGGGVDALLAFEDGVVGFKQPGEGAVGVLHLEQGEVRRQRG